MMDKEYTHYNLNNLFDLVSSPEFRNSTVFFCD